MPVPEWLIPRPFRPGYTDTSKKMPGESQFEYDIRRGLVAVGSSLFKSPTSGPGVWGSQVDEYLRGGTAPVTGPVLPKKPPFAQEKPTPTPTAQPAAQSQPVPFSREAVADMVHWASNRGATVTSWDRNAGHNKNVGGVGNSYHLTGQAFDSVPPKGTSMSQWQAELKKRAPGWDVINEGDHVHVEPPQGVSHSADSPLSAAVAASGLNAPTPGFDASGYQRADSLLAQAQANQMQPFGATYQQQSLPDLPKPDAFVTPDFSAGDAALAEARPKNPFGATPEDQAAGQLKMRRMDYFAGMAQALASIDWSKGPGLGELFAKIGAGAVMGAKVGDDEVRDKMEKFDAAMQQYQLAVANRDDRKAGIAAEVANKNIESLNTYKRDQWTVQAKEIEKYNPRVVDGVLITYNRVKNPDGTETVKEQHTPIDASRQNAQIMARANVAIGAGNAHNEFEWQTYRANREVAGALFPYYMSEAGANGDFATRDNIYGIGLAEASNSVVDSGRWEEMYQRYIPGGAEAAAATRAEAARLAGVQTGVPPTAEQQKTMNDYISSQMITDFVNSNKSWALVGGMTTRPDRGPAKRPPDSAVTSSVAAQRERDRKVTRSVNSKGQVTTSERY